MQTLTKNDSYKRNCYFQYENKTLHSNGSIQGQVHACETFQERCAPCRLSIVWYHTSKNQSDCTNSLKCLRTVITKYELRNVMTGKRVGERCVCVSDPNKSLNTFWTCHLIIAMENDMWSHYCNGEWHGLQWRMTCDAKTHSVISYTLHNVEYFVPGIPIRQQEY